MSAICSRSVLHESASSNALFSSSPASSDWIASKVDFAAAADADTARPNRLREAGSGPLFEAAACSTSSTCSCELRPELVQLASWLSLRPASPSRRAELVQSGDERVGRALRLVDRAVDVRLLDAEAFGGQSLHGRLDARHPRAHVRANAVCLTPVWRRRRRRRRNRRRQRRARALQRQLPCDESSVG